MTIISVVRILFIFSVHADTFLPNDVPLVRNSPDPFYHEQGFRMGNILNLARDIYGNYEGQLMLGIGSSPAVIVDRSCSERDTPKQPSQTSIGQGNKCIVDRNPWEFSSVRSDIYKTYNSSGSGPVVIFYVKEASHIAEFFSSLSATALWTDTRNFVWKIWPIKDLPKLPKFFPKKNGDVPWSDKLAFDTFSVEGRLVKATMDGTILKTFEITIQESGYGSNFKRLSVSDAEMYDYLVATMFSGRPIRLKCVDLFSIESRWQRVYPGYTTPFRVLSVQLL